MDSIEASARTSHEAIQQALAQLGIREDQADIHILTEGSRGILGIGAEDARVRVSRKPVAPAPAPAQPSVPARAKTSGRRRAPARIAPTVDEVASGGEALEARAPATRHEAPVGEPPTGEPSAGWPTEAHVSTMNVGEVAAIAHQVVLELVGAMGITARVNVRNVASRADQPLDGDNPIVLDITGDDLGILIGRRGETLSALQLITNLIVGRRTREWARIVVDVEGYRLRREESLRSLALRMAERVRYGRAPFTMEAMPAHERRIVHIALKDNPYVTTESHGEGEERRVTISPRR